MIKAAVFTAALLAIASAGANSRAQDQSRITFEPQTKVFRVDTAASTYAFGINERKELQPIYWGARLAPSDPLPQPTPRPEHASFDITTSITPQEYAGWGAGLYVEPALKITFPDGNRDLVLHYVSHKIDHSSLVISMKDIERNVTVDLHYDVDAATGILGRSAAIQNGTNQPLVIEQAAAATWNLPRATDYSLSYLTGRWGGEWNLQQEAIRPGQRVLESRRGSTGHQNTPWFAIARGVPPSTSDADQDHGDVWFGALAWSGSWRITVEQDQLQAVRVTGGFNPFDFGYHLAPGERLTTPVFYAGYTHDGMGGASRLLHRFELSTILPQAPHAKPRPVIYNSWEATEFDVNEAGQVALAEKAASIGVERFVMDDGWFGARNTDHAGLGDWYVNKTKFPNGIGPLIKRVRALGMDFGLWVEPEMVNPDSDLYRAHPDWALNFPGRPRTEGRNQLVLNLARSDVREYVFNFLDKILKENDIAFLKWDYNRNWAEPGWDAVGPENEKQVYVKYVENLYSILKQLRAAHPGVEIESCSGGGGRVDLGILHYTDEVWPSDNTDPFDRLSLQDGFTYPYTPGVMMSWVTDSPNGFNGRVTSLDYRFLSSMQGGLGIGANLLKWQPEDFATATKLVAAYKQVRETVQHGALYRLVSPRNGSESSVTETVANDGSEAVVFAFLHSSQLQYPFPTIRLRGLDQSANYRIEWIEGKADEAPSTASGAYWMSQGIDLDLRGDFKAGAFRLVKVRH